MAKTIPQLTDATTVNAADELIIQQGGITKRATGAELAKGLNTINGTINVRDFGAVGDGVADDTAAIQASINAVPNNGGTVYFPSGRYRVTSTIVVGNGTDSSLSTQNAVKIIGDGIGAYFGTSGGTEIFYDGIVDNDIAVLSFHGSGDGFRLDGIEINANARAGCGLRLFSVRTSTFSSFACLNFTKCGLDLKIRSGPSNSVKFASGNLFQNFYIDSSHTANTPGGTFGILLQGNYANNDDWHRNTFIGGVAQIAKSLSGLSPFANALHLGFTDSNTFIECDFKVFDHTQVAGTGYSLYLNAANNNFYPENNFFYGCALMAEGTASVAWNEPSGESFGDHVFYNYTTKDLETVPSHPKLRIITDRGDAKGMGDYEIRKNSGSITFRPTTATTGYRIVGNVDNSNDFGFTIQRSTDLSSWTTLFIVNSLGRVIPQTDNTGTIGAIGNRWSEVIATEVRLGDGNRRIVTGTGSPESNVTASVGSLFLRTDGGAGTTLYVKESGTGNTGWVAK